MSGTAVPQPEFTQRGFIAPPENAILAGVWRDFQAAFGGDLNEALETPQGQLVSSDTAIIGDMFAQFVYLTQQVDPAYAAGRMQDAIARIYFLTRNPATSTVVTATCSGGTGVVIPVGALVQDEDGTLYSCTSGGTIPSGGSIDLQFVCVATGPIPCPAGSLNRIFQVVPGWDSVLNATDGTLGSAVETRAEFELRREATVEKNGRNTLGAIQGAVMALPAVLDAYTTENFGSTPLVINGVAIPAHSVYVAATGGTDQDVAEAIFQKKPPGCNMAGNTTVTVQDSQSGYVPPLPTYTMRFQRPAPLVVSFLVRLQNGSDVPADAVQLIQAAVILAFAGADGGTRARIGSEIFASRFYAPIAAVGPWVRIIEVTISDQPSATFNGHVVGSVLTVLGLTSGTIGVGDVVRGLDILAGTTIVSFGTGSGGVGTYNVSISQDAPDEVMTTAPLGLTNYVQIDQAPVTGAAEIAVVFS